MLCGLLLSLQSLLAQTIITGKVIGDKDAAPIAGATISVKNSRASTVTAPDGSFSINAPTNATLVVTYVGYRPVELKASPLPLVATLSESDNA